MTTMVISIAMATTQTRNRLYTLNLQLFFFLGSFIQVELVEGSSYLGQPLPFSLTTLIWIEVIVIGYIEYQRNAELDPVKRLYPGGYFDPLGLASDPGKLENLQLAEIKHARLAMVAFLIFGIQAAFTGKGPISFVATFNQ